MKIVFTIFKTLILNMLATGLINCLSSNSRRCNSVRLWIAHEYILITSILTTMYVR